MATPANGPLADLPVPSDEVLDSIMVDLGLADSPEVEAHKARLVAHVRSYAIACVFRQHFPSVHEDRARALRIAEHIDNLLAEFDAFHPMIPMLSERKLRDVEGYALPTLLKNLRSLGVLLGHFGSTKFANKQPKSDLRHAVGGLMLELELMTGRRAAASYRQSQKNLPAKPNSPEGRAIASLLRVVDPDLKDEAIAGQIHRIRREFKGKTSSCWLR